MKRFAPLFAGLAGALLLAANSPIASAEEPPRSFGFEAVKAVEDRLQGELVDKFFADEANLPLDDESFDDYETRVGRWVEDRFREAGVKIGPEARQEVNQTVNQLTPEAVAGKTTAVAAPEAFSDRVTDAIADFLPLLGLSMDAVSTSEDKKSVTFKLNPWKFAHGEFSLAATAAEPELFSPLAEAVREPAREKERKTLLTEVDDFGDVTAALNYGYTRRAVSWQETRRMYGRSYDLYQGLVDELLESAWGLVDTRSVQLRDDVLGNRFLADLMRIADPEGDDDTVFAAKFKEIRSWIREGRVPFAERELLEALLRSRIAIQSVISQVDSWNLDALPSLVDNQPQLTFTASHRVSDELVGPDSTSATLRYEMGSKNFNAMLREYHHLLASNNAQASPFQAFQDVIADKSYRAENKLIFTLTYKRTEAYDLTHSYRESVTDPATGGSQEFPRTASVKLDRASEWRGSLAFTRFFLRARDQDNKMGVELPRLTFSVEAVELQDDPERQNRVVGRLSYVMPATKGISVPFTLTWASRPEFLGEQDRNLSAHLGFTYKLDRGDGQ